MKRLKGYHQSEETLQYLEDVKRSYNSSSLSKIEFLPFCCVDNYAGEENSNYVLQQNIQGLNRLVASNDNKIFLGCVLYNNSLEDLLDSFLTHRNRPYRASANRSQLTRHDESLSLLDHRIFCLYLRLASPAEQTNDTAYALAIPEIVPIMTAFSFPRLLSVCAILGDSNITYSQKLFCGAAAINPLWFEEQLDICSSETYQLLFEVSKLLEDMTVPVKLEKKNKVVDLSKSRPKKNTLRERQFSSPGSAELKIGNKSKLSDVNSLATYVLDICYSMLVWVEAMSEMIYMSDRFPRIWLIGIKGLSISPLCGMMIASVALLYENIVPLLEKAIYSIGDNTGIASTAQFCREILIQVTITLFEASSQRAKLQNNPGVHQSNLRNVSERKELMWDEVIDKLLSPDGPENLQNTTSKDVVDIIVGGGGLLADVWRAYSASIKEWLDYLFQNGDSCRREYVMMVLSEGDAGYMSRHVADSCNSKSTNLGIPENNMTLDSPHVYSEGSSTASPPKVDDYLENVNAIRSIFPDYSKPFIIDVLKAFDNDTNRAIDGLLSDNLPPALMNVDRTSSVKIKAAFIGKSSTDSSVSVSKIEAKDRRTTTSTSYRLELSKEEKARQKQILMNISQQEELDGILLSQSEAVSEFIDDYDDQYDDAGLGNNIISDKNDSAVGDTFSIIIDKKEGIVKSKSKSQKAVKKGSLRGIGTAMADNDVERQNIMRLNKLIREEEAENEFWQGMRNTNRIPTRVQENLKDENIEETDDGSIESVDSLDKSGPSNILKKSSGGQNKKLAGTCSGKLGDDINMKKDITTGKAKKPKTKTFDKHRQKNRSAKKFGGFC